MAALRNLVPMSPVADVERSIAFYEQLGFEERNRFEEDGTLHWAYLSSGDALLMLSRADEPVEPAQQGMHFYVYVEDVKRYHSELADKGIEVGPIETRFYMPGGEFEVRDPDGYRLLIGHT
jgi:catechol 2,3-dioxygenase-like lactoylglutathione lyase family enzyme